MRTGPPSKRGTPSAARTLLYDEIFSAGGWCFCLSRSKQTSSMSSSEEWTNYQSLFPGRWESQNFPFFLMKVAINSIFR
jgi:hypothetical protein